MGEEVIPMSPPHEQPVRALCSYSVAAITEDFESSNLGSIPSGSLNVFFALIIEPVWNLLTR